MPFPTRNHIADCFISRKTVRQFLRGKHCRRLWNCQGQSFFPEFRKSSVHSRTINYHIGVNVEELFRMLAGQIQAGLCFGAANCESLSHESPCSENATRIAADFISRLPEIRRILATDVEAAYFGDPAAELPWRDYLLLSCNKGGN